MLRLDIHWRAPLPAGPKLFIANHPSATDPFLIHLLSSKHLSVMIRESAFLMPVFGRLLRHCRQIAVTAGQGKQALEKAHQCIQSGHSVGIFPEGWISPLKGYNRPHTGAARLALATEVAVIPVGIYLLRERRVHLSSRLSGEYSEAFWYIRGPYGMTVGKPMHFQGNAEDEQLVRSVTEHMMAKIHELAEESERRIHFALSGSRLPAI
jgi:1-acyl-sn-glycerol-3-phosphate acyltransferase